jgi:DNA gyrase/topoisomerase IV subunit B
VHLLLEVLAYVQDEAIAGGAKRARIECLGDRFVVSDDGRGTQLVRHPDTGALLVKPIMASADLRYFGRDDAPLLASGAKRSGISVVNALSSTLTHSSLRQGSIAWVHPRGTRVQFCPDDEIFGNVSSADVAERLRLRCANFAPLVVAVT